MEHSLKLRLLSAAVLIPLALGAVWAGGHILTAAAIICAVVIAYEYTWFALPLPNIQRAIFFLLTLIPLLGFFAHSWTGLAIGFLCSSIAGFFISLYIVEHETHAPNVEHFLPAFSLGLCYVGMLGPALVASTMLPDSRFLIGQALVLTIASDSFAYFGGRAIGGRKLAPRVSPKKTVSGAICGLLGAMLCVLFYRRWMHGDWEVFSSIAFGLPAGILAQTGDLVESLVKRIYGVKDASNLIPGHGGLLDRIDALLFVTAFLLLC